MGLFRRSKKGQPYTGTVIRVGEAGRELVKWPGVYGVKKDGSVDPKCRLERSTDEGDIYWVRAD